MKYFFLTSLIIIILHTSSFAEIMNSDSGGNPSIFDNFGENTYNSFISPIGTLHVAAAGSTYYLSKKNIDYRVQRYFTKHTEYEPLAFPTAYIGYGAPILLCGSLYGYGKYNNDREVFGAGCAVIQANMICVIYNTAAKAVTGRPNPDPDYSGDKKAYSKKFRFGFMRGGVHYGWPSGHSCTTVASVTALAMYYPDSLWIKITGYSYSAYMMAGMVIRERSSSHWFSDTVAGALMGFAIGYTVGKKYHDDIFGADNNGPGKIMISPSFDGETIGLSLNISL